MTHLLGLTVGIILICFGAGLLFLFQGPPFVPSGDATVQRILTMVAAEPARHIVDMGSGDGKLVIALAQAGYRVTGIELNPRLVLVSRRRIRRLGLQDTADILWGNFWRYDVSPYDVVVLFVIRHIMPRLERKLRAELRPGTRILSNFFVFPTLDPVERQEDVATYRIEATLP